MINYKVSICGTKEASQILGVSRQTIYNAIHHGRIKTAKLGRMYLMNNNDLPSVIVKRRNTSGIKKVSSYGVS